MDGRAFGEATPFQDPVVELGRDIAYFPLRAQVLDRLRQPFYLLAQSQRRRQQFLGGHAFPAQVIAQPCLGVIRQCLFRQRLARAGQVIEGTALLSGRYLLIDPGGEAHFRWLTFCHCANSSITRLRRRGQ